MNCNQNCNQGRNCNCTDEYITGNCTTGHIADRRSKFTALQFVQMAVVVVSILLVVVCMATAN